MRIAMIVTGGVDRSGRERVIPVLLSLIERLSRQHTLAVYALRYLPTPASYPLLGATVHDLGRPEGFLRQYLALCRALRRNGPFDVIYAHWALPSGAVASLAGRTLGIPSVVVMDSGEFVGLADIHYGAQLAWRQRIAVRLTARLAHRLIVCTRYQQRLAAQHGIQTTLIPLGVDVMQFSPPSDRVEGPPWRLLHIGSINPVKDHTLLLNAVKALAARGCDVRLDIVGEDRSNGAIPVLASRLELHDRVTFHGVLSSEALVPFYQRAHLLVLSSRHEAAGVVVLEAAASGLPVVGTAVGHIADWMPDRAAGVAAHDAEGLATAIDSLLRDRERRLTFAAAARQWTLEHDADWSARELVKIFQEVGRSES